MKRIVYFLMLGAILNIQAGWYKNFWLSSLQGSRKGEDIDYKQADLFSKVYSEFSEKNELVADGIPKIIHFIWVGGKIPTIYNFCIQSWRRHHPDWQVILWDDQKISNLEMQNQHIFDALQNNGAKADVVRYEVLNRFGGFYVDIDFFCVKPIDFYAEHSNLFIGSFLEDIVGNGIIGVSKKHPFISELVKQVGLINSQDLGSLNPTQIMDLVGPCFFGKVLNRYLDDNRDTWKAVALLPSSYLHSFPNTMRDDFWSCRKTLVDVLDESVYPETLAVHLWSVSWVRIRSDNDNDVALFDQALAIAGPEFVSLDFVRKSDGATALHVLAKTGNAKQLSQLALAGADLNSKDCNGDTPLILAVKSKRVNSVKALVDAGADKDITDSNGMTPLEYAKNTGFKRAVKILSNGSIKVKEPTLISAVRAKQLRKVEVLLRHGYDVNCRDHFGKLPIDYAIEGGDDDMTKLLSVSGAVCPPDHRTMKDDSARLKKIVILNCSYNNEKYCKANLESIFKQTYPNWEMYYVDDCSTDRTAELVQDMIQRFGVEDKVHFIRNSERQGALANYYHVINQCNDEDIIVVVDGDDCLYDNGALSYVADVYKDPNVWLTYGTYVPQYPPFPVTCGEVSGSIAKTKHFFRQHDWRFSHLRTFYAGLFKKIKLNDLMYKGEFFKSASDVATMIPMLEMCGVEQRRFKFIRKVLYLYNNGNPICDFKVDPSTELPDYVKSLPPYEPLEELFV